MLPAVVTMPPFQGPLYATRHASRFLTASQTSKNPSIGVDTEANATPRFQPIGAMGKLGNGIYRIGTCCAGMYTKPVLGLKAIGCQLCAPNGPGLTSTGLPLSL